MRGLGLGVGRASRRGVDAGPAYANPVKTAPWAWWIGDQLRTLAGGAAQAWGDYSGNGRALDTSLGAAGRPTVAAAYQGGRDALAFDGARAIRSASNAGAWVLAQPLTVVVLGRALQPDANPRFVVASGGAYAAGYTSSAGLTAHGGAAALTAAGVATTTLKRLVFVFDGASSRVRVDGAQVAAGNPGAAGLGGVKVGGYDGGAANNITGHVCEVIIYPAALGDADCAAVEAYLASAWLL